MRACVVLGALYFWTDHRKIQCFDVEPLACRYADAVHDYEMALKLDPDNTQVKDNLLRASHALAAQDHPSRPGTRWAPY